VDSIFYSFHKMLVKGAEYFTRFQVFSVTLAWECIDRGVWELV